MVWHGMSVSPSAYRSMPTANYTSFSGNYESPMSARSQASFAKQPLVRPVHFRSVNVASSQSANIRWASPDPVNFMDHLYFLTNLVLDYLLEGDLPQELMNQTLLDDPVSVLTEHRNELIQHFHKLIIAACSCLCIGISIPLFGFMIACCWCSSGNRGRSKSSKRSGRSNARSVSRSRGHNRESDTDWLALASRDSSSPHYNSRSGGSRHHRELERRIRHARGHRRNGPSGSSLPNSNHYRSRSIPPSLKYETSCHQCLRTFFSSNLFLILLLVSFFAVCAFVTNEYVDSGVKQLPKSLNQSIDELQQYLNNTDYEVENLLKVNFNQLENEINLRLDTSGVIIKHKLAVSSEAIALANLSDIVMEFNDTKTRLEKLDRELSTLKSRLNTAKRGLKDFKSKIQNCPPEHCSLLRKKYRNLDDFIILPRYEKLPDVKPLIEKVTQLITSGIVAKVQRGKDDFDRFGVMIQREVNSTSPLVKAQLSAIGAKLSSLAGDVSQSIRASDFLLNQTRSSTKKFNQYSEFELYRRYACLAGASVILFILLCFTLGWLYGSCRLQPTTRTYKTHVTTSASASFPFSCGIFTVFVIFLPMILAAIALFLTGSVGDKIVCRVIKHPEQNQSKQIYAMLQNKFSGSNLSLNPTDGDKVTTEQIDGVDYKIYRPNYADLITRCHQNQSIYKVFKLDQYDKVHLADDTRNRRLIIGFDKNFNLNSTLEFKKASDIDKRLKQLIKQIDLDSSRITLLSTDAEAILRNSMGLSFDDLETSFASLYENGVAISHIDIEQLVKDIQAQRATLPLGSDMESELNLAIILATSFTDQLLPNITSSLLGLKEGVRHLKLRMFYGRNSFGTVVTELISKVRSAENQLRSEGKTLLKMAANDFIEDLNALVDQYANHVRNQVENVIGQCEPVSRAMNSTTSTLCDEIMLPFNGYWLSTIASLILILPATFLAYALKGLYRLVRRGPHSHHHNHHNYSYTDQEDEVSYEDDGEEIALAYHLAHHNHFQPQKPSSSSAAAASAPSAPTAADEGNWSPSSASYVHTSRPPPYAV